MSTSLLLDFIHFKGEPYSNRQHLLKIYVPKGSIGVYVNPVVHRKEQEILFAPNRGLRLISQPRFDSVIGKNIFECLMLNKEVF